MGTLDFFLLESGEYLERLDALVQAPAGAFPQADELLRLCRAFNGSAIMASQHGMARAGQGLVACAKAIRENRLGWTEATRAELIRAIDDVKILMRRLRQPEQGDTERAEGIGISLDRMSGRASAQLRASQGPGLDAGGRAFVAREAASIASVLQHAARTLRADPGSRDALSGVPAAMSALRGVAILNDLPPLGDILSSIEFAARDVTAAGGTLGVDVADVFEAGARALARAAREVVDQGRPDGEADESHAFAARLFAVLSGGEIVGIESLFYEDAGPHIVQQGTAPAGGTGLARVELVSQGEYLSAAAAELSKVETRVQRDLRLFGVASRLRPMVGAGGSPLSNAMGRFAEAARDAIGRGGASHAVDHFVAAIRQAGDALIGAQAGDEQAIADHVSAAATDLSKLTAAMTTRAVPRPKVSEPQVTKVTEGAEASAPAAPAAPVIGDSDLTTSYLTLEQLIADRGMPMGSIEELLGVPTAAPRTTAPRSLSPDDAGVVPVQTLVYSGEGALRRVLQLRAELDTMGPNDPRLKPLLHEVFDLVELGLGAGR